MFLASTLKIHDLFPQAFTNGDCTISNFFLKCKLLSGGCWQCFKRYIFVLFPLFRDSMLCVGGRISEQSVIFDSEIDLNYKGHLSNEGHRRGEGRVEQRLLSPLRSLALSPIPHMEQQENQHLDQNLSYTDLLLSNSDLYHLDLPGAPDTDMNSHRGSTGTLPRGYKYKPSNKIAQDEDVYDTIPGRPKYHNKGVDVYGTIPRDYNRNLPKRTSSFQQLHVPSASSTLVRSQSCKLTEAERPQFKTATRKFLYEDNCIQEGFLRPTNPPLKRKDCNVQESGKRNAFSVRTAIKRKLASLTGHSKGEHRFISLYIALGFPNEMLINQLKFVKNKSNSMFLRKLIMAHSIIVFFS